MIVAFDCFGAIYFGEVVIGEAGKSNNLTLEYGYVKYLSRGNAICMQLGVGGRLHQHGISSLCTLHGVTNASLSVFEECTHKAVDVMCHRRKVHL